MTHISNTDLDNPYRRLHTKVLIIIDMQNDFIDGALGTAEAFAIVPNVRKKVEEAVRNGDMIIYTRDTHFENYLETTEGKKLPVKHCIIGTKGWQIPDELLPNSDVFYYIHDKYTFGSTRLPMYIYELNDECFDIDEIELVGLCTDICVVSNALLLKSYFYNICEVSVDATCCAGVTPETHEAALKTMEMCQINIKR